MELAVMQIRQPHVMCMWMTNTGASKVAGKYLPAEEQSVGRQAPNTTLNRRKSNILFATLTASYSGNPSTLAH